MKQTSFMICSTEWDQIPLQVSQDNLENPDSRLAGVAFQVTPNMSPIKPVFNQLYILLPGK